MGGSHFLAIADSHEPPLHRLRTLRRRLSRRLRLRFLPMAATAVIFLLSLLVAVDEFNSDNK